MGSSSKKKRKENLQHVQEGRLVVFTNNSSVKRHWRQKKTGACTTEAAKCKAANSEERQGKTRAPSCKLHGRGKLQRQISLQVEPHQATLQKNQTKTTGTVGARPPRVTHSLRHCVSNLLGT